MRDVQAMIARSRIERLAEVEQKRIDRLALLDETEMVQALLAVRAFTADSIAREQSMVQRRRRACKTFDAMRDSILDESDTP